MDELTRTQAALEVEALHLMESALAPATRRAYLSDWKRFELWCESMEYTSLPAQPSTLVLYIASSSPALSVGSIVRAVTAIKTIHLAKGFPSPASAFEVRAALSGLRKLRGAPLDKADPLSYSDLSLMVKRCDRSIAGLRNAALLALGWCGALRRSELVALNLSDLRFSAEGLALVVRRGKADKHRVGREIGIPRAPAGSSWCPVETIDQWCSRLRREMDESSLDSAVLRAFGPAGRLWFAKPRGRLSARMVCIIVAQAARHAGLTGSYSAHSLRRGLATEAARCGVPEWALQQHTGHASLSCLTEYIHKGRLWVDSPLVAIFGAAHGAQMG